MIIKNTLRSEKSGLRRAKSELEFGNSGAAVSLIIPITIFSIASYFLLKSK
jgi:hypothetical protein